MRVATLTRAWHGKARWIGKTHRLTRAWHGRSLARWGRKDNSCCSSNLRRRGQVRGKWSRVERPPVRGAPVPGSAPGQEQDECRHSQQRDQGSPQPNGQGNGGQPAGRRQGTPAVRAEG